MTLPNNDAILQSGAMLLLGGLTIPAFINIKFKLPKT